METVHLLFLAGYFALLVFLGLKFSRRMKSLEDFFLASRSLSSFLVFLSLTASWFGATSILVTTDEAFRAGWSALWLVGVPAVATVLIFALFLARPIRRLSILTLPELVERHYGKTVRHLASALIFWYMAVLAASQMVAVGNFLQPFLGLPYFWCLVLSTAAVCVYLVSGGLRSVVVTDILQCLFLAVGAGGLVFFLFRRESPQPVFPADFFFDWKRNILIALSFTLAWTISPIAWQRIQAARSEGGARRGLFAAAGGFVLLYSLVALIGILSRSLFPAGELSHPLLSELIVAKLGTLGGGFLLLAVVAAILSTLDTAINAGALALTRDIYEQVFKPSDKGRTGLILASRISTFLVAGLAFAVATRFQSILKTIGLASEIMAEGLFVPGLAMFVLKARAPWAGGLSLAFGGGFALAGFLSETKIVPLHLPAWPFSVPYGLALSLAGFAVGLLLDKSRSSA